MQSFVFIACLLVSLSVANPVEVERRALGGLYSASSQQQQQQSAASSSSVNAYGGGLGYGGIGGLGYGGIGSIGGGVGGISAQSSYNSQSSSSSYSSSNVISGFNGISSQIAAIQGMMSSGSFTQTIAMQQMSRLASSMQYTLSQSAGCGCFGQGNFISNASSVFSQFYSLMTSMQLQFGGSFGSLLQPFGGLSSTFQSFFNSYQSSGYSINSIIPPGLPSLLGGCIPGFTNMVGFK